MLAGRRCGCSNSHHTAVGGHSGGWRVARPYWQPSRAEPGPAARPPSQDRHAPAAGATTIRAKPCCRAAVADAAPTTASPAILHLVGDLPIRECIGEVLQGLDRASCLVLQAPPGAGKTTAVPLAMLLHSPEYLTASKILVLEPRRVAAKAAARRMASMLSERPGETVGYRVKLETCVGPRTRVEVVTNGILLRMLQQDPGLQGVGAILFDEFHERGLDSDLALTLCLDAQQLARPDLRLAVMSATLGGGLAERLSALMAPPGAAASDSPVPVVVSEGRSYPVAIKYLGLPGPQRGELEQDVAAAVVEALKQTDGDVLTFLPGVGEIRSVERLLLRSLGRGQAQVLQLHGNQAPAQQDEAIRSSRALGGGNGPRRVILSTPIAESSVTIDGVRAVVDSGLRRSPAYDTQTGVNRLRLTRISAASAEQRAGRAGRTAPGVAYRLWEPQDFLEEATPPEIEEADLTPAVLELAIWGTSDGSGLPWLDAPDPARIESAQELLRNLGALDDSGRPTEEGRQMARFGVHPRFAHMVLRGAELGASELAAVLASLLSERDVLRGSTAGSRSADIAVRLRFLEAVADGGGAEGGGDGAAAKRVLQAAGGILKQLRQERREGLRAQQGEGASGDEERIGEEGEAGEGEAGEEGEDEGLSFSAHAPPQRDFQSAWTSQMAKEGLVGALLALAYPDRIAKQERGNRWLMADGRVACLPIAGDPVATAAQYLAIAELGGAHQTDRNDRIYSAAALTATAVTRYLSCLVTRRRVVTWASASKAVVGREQQRLGALVVEERAVAVSDEEALPALIRGFKEMGGLQHLGLPKTLESFQQRVCWLRQQQLRQQQQQQQEQAGGSSSLPAGSPRLLPDLSDDALIASSSVWLRPYAAGVRSKSDMQKLDWQAILYQLVGGWEVVQEVEAQATSHVVMPTGTSVLIDYSREQPIVSIKIQEVFGMMRTPTLAGGRVPVLMELLSPAGRPLQVTADLAGFWQSSYALVRQDMKGRYPKHYWPEDPSQAEATKLSKSAMDRALKQQEQQRQQQQQQQPAQSSKRKK